MKIKIKKFLIIFLSFIVAVLSIARFTYNFFPYSNIVRSLSLCAEAVAGIVLAIGAVLLILVKDNIVTRFYIISAVIYFSLAAQELITNLSGNLSYHDFDDVFLYVFWGVVVLLMRLFINQNVASVFEILRNFIISNIKFFTENKILFPGDIKIEKIYQKLNCLKSSKYKIISTPIKIYIHQDLLRGCLIRSEKEDDSSTSIFVGAFIPSTKLAIVLSIVCVGLAGIVMLKIDLIVGIIFLPISFFLRLIPSKALVCEIRHILKETFI